MLPPGASPWRPSAFRVWKAACLLLLVRVCWTLRSQCTTYALLWCNCSPLRSGWRAQDGDLTCQAGTMARDGQLITTVEGSSSDHSIMRRPHNTGELDSAKAAWAALPTTRNKLWPGTRASDNHGRMQAVGSESEPRCRPATRWPPYSRRRLVSLSGVSGLGASGAPMGCASCQLLQDCRTKGPARRASPHTLTPQRQRQRHRTCSQHQFGPVPSILQRRGC